MSINPQHTLAVKVKRLNANRSAELGEGGDEPHVKEAPSSRKVGNLKFCFGADNESIVREIVHNDG